MKLLLDTHTFMWWHSEPEYIPKNTLILLQDPDNEVILSVVSLWEMQIKIQLGKLNLRDDLELMLKIQQEQNHISLISVTLPHILELKNLPLHHKDPFDRILIAQAINYKLAIVGCDIAFDAYSVQRIWE